MSIAACRYRFLNWNNLSPVNSNMVSIGNDLVFHNSAAEPVIYPIARHIFSTCRMGLQQLSKVRAGWAVDAG